MEFRSWGKTTRLDSEVVVTEKIDGTNAAVVISSVFDPQDTSGTLVDLGGKSVLVGAQSRKKTITPDNDNAGFATWVWDNASVLARELGPGYHYGEWWGHKIQREYGRQNGERYFSLFDVYRYGTKDRELAGLSVVPVIAQGTFTAGLIELAQDMIWKYGSLAVTDDFYQAEGIVVLFKNNKARFKVKQDGEGGDPNSIRLAPFDMKEGLAL